MAARVEIKKRLNSNSAFAKKIEAQTSRRVAAAVSSIAAEVANEVNQIIRSELVTDRPTNRRHAHTRRLLNSIKVDVDWDGVGFPLRLTVRSAAPAAKVNALEKGARPHVIRAKNGRFLVFPSTKYTGSATERGPRGRVVRLESGGSITGRQVRQAYGGKMLNTKTGRVVNTRYVRTPAVLHPGNRAYHFMERGLELAIAKLKRRL